jgi:hypothetical protein
MVAQLLRRLWQEGHLSLRVQSQPWQHMRPQLKNKWEI